MFDIEKINILLTFFVLKKYSIMSTNKLRFVSKVFYQKKASTKCTVLYKLPYCRAGSGSRSGQKPVPETNRTVNLSSLWWAGRSGRPLKHQMLWLYEASKNAAQARGSFEMPGRKKGYRESKTLSAIFS
jgi:hypothetical protein